MIYATRTRFLYKKGSSQDFLQFKFNLIKMKIIKWLIYNDIF